MSNSATIILRHELPILKENKQPKLISEIDRESLKQIILEELQHAVINSDLLEEALKDWISSMMPGSSQSKLDKYMDPSLPSGEMERGPQGASPEVDEPARMTPGTSERSWRKEFVFTPEQEMIMQKYVDSEHVAGRFTLEQVREATREQIVGGKDANSVMAYMEQKITAGEEATSPIAEPVQDTEPADNSLMMASDRHLRMLKNLVKAMKPGQKKQFFNILDNWQGSLAEGLDTFSNILVETMIRKYNKA